MIIDHFCRPPKVSRPSAKISFDVIWLKKSIEKIQRCSSTREIQTGKYYAQGLLQYYRFAGRKVYIIRHTVVL